MTEAEVQRLMGLLVRVIDAATQFGHPRNNDATDLDLAKRDFESALRELLPAPAAPEMPNSPGFPDGSQAPADARGALAAFGAWAAKEFRDSLADVGGGSAQDAMERFGVIVKRTVTEPCGEGCICLEYGEFPHECFVFPDAVSAAIGAMAAPTPQEQKP